MTAAGSRGGRSILWAMASAYQTHARRLVVRTTRVGRVSAHLAACLTEQAERRTLASEHRRGRLWVTRQTDAQFQHGARRSWLQSIGAVLPGIHTCADLACRDLRVIPPTELETGLSPNDGCDRLAAAAACGKQPCRTACPADWPPFPGHNPLLRPRPKQGVGRTASRCEPPFDAELQAWRVICRARSALASDHAHVGRCQCRCWPNCGALAGPADRTLH